MELHEWIQPNKARAVAVEIRPEGALTSDEIRAYIDEYFGPSMSDMDLMIAVRVMPSRVDGGEKRFLYMEEILNTGIPKKVIISIGVAVIVFYAIVAYLIHINT